MKYDWFQVYELDFKELQQKKGILNPWDQRRKLHEGTVTWHNDNCFSLREYTPEEYKLNEYWKEKIEEWLIAEERFVTECVLRDHGYAAAEEYALGQFRKRETKEFFENICPCDYGLECNLFCKNFIQCLKNIDKKGEKNYDPVC